MSFEASTILKPAGAEAANAPGRERPIAEQYAAATEGAAFRLMPERAVVRLVGDDRVPFLHGMCSQDIKTLKPGMVRYGLMLTDRAHVLADFYVYAKEQELLLEFQRELWPPVKAQLEKLIVADDVELVEDESLCVMEIAGRGAPRAVESAFSGAVAVPQSPHYAAADGLLLACFERRGCPGFTLLGESGALHNAKQRLAGAAIAPPALEVGEAAMEIVRIENGEARVGLDTNAKTIALEARLEPAISFAKGCYLGQETIERVSAHGQLKKRLFGLRIRAERLAEHGAAVLLADQEVGRVTSAALSPRLGSLALAILHHSAWAADSEVTIADPKGRLKAMVSDLPFS